MSHRWEWVLLACISSGCAHTAIEPMVQKESSLPYRGETACQVRDYESASELPTGSKNLGWVSVDSTGNDEETVRLLRQKICEKGGDALSGMAWVPEPETDKLQLRANGWLLP